MLSPVVSKYQGCRIPPLSSCFRLTITNWRQHHPRCHVHNCLSQHNKTLSYDDDGFTHPWLFISVAQQVFEASPITLHRHSVVALFGAKVRTCSSAIDRKRSPRPASSASQQKSFRHGLSKSNTPPSSAATISVMFTPRSVTT